jgi:hypothetical protein
MKIIQQAALVAILLMAGVLFCGCNNGDEGPSNAEGIKNANEELPASDANAKIPQYPGKGPKGKL